MKNPDQLSSEENEPQKTEPQEDKEPTPEKFSDKILFTVTETDAPMPKDVLGEDEKKSMVDEAKKVFAELEKKLNISEKEVLLCGVTMNPGHKDLEQQLRTDIRSEIKRHSFVSGFGKEEEDLSEEEIDRRTEEELMNDLSRFRPGTYLDFEVNKINKNGKLKATDRYVSNVQIIAGMYIVKYRGRLSLEDLVDNIVSQLNTK